MNNKQSFWSIRKLAGWGVKQQGTAQTASVHAEQVDAWQEARRLSGGNKNDVPKPERRASILSRILKLRVRPAHQR